MERVDIPGITLPVRQMTPFDLPACAPEVQRESLHTMSPPEDVVAHRVGSMLVLRRAHSSSGRRVLYLNSYGMSSVWSMIMRGAYPGAHLWGAIELARMGYEVAMPPESNRRAWYYNYRRDDLKHVSFAASWLGRDGIVYSAHTVLFWLPLLVRLGLLRSPVVTLLYGRGETLRLATAYRGVLGLTKAAAARASELAPHAAVERIGWGVDLALHPHLPYEPKWFLNCGKTRRDFHTLAAAAEAYPAPLRLINTTAPAGVTWPAHVELLTGGRGNDWQTVAHSDLVHQHYAGCIAALIILQDDPGEQYAAGYSQMIEALALGKPVIMTRTGALASDIDIEAEGCGLFVPPNDSAALARAMRILREDPARAEAMGAAGRRLCERYYNMGRFSTALHRFFEQL